MKARAMIPAVEEVVREALIVLIASALAAAVVRSLPAKYRNLFTIGGTP